MNIGQMVTSPGHNSRSMSFPNTDFCEGILNATPNRTERENSAPRKGADGSRRLTVLTVTPTGARVAVRPPAPDGSACQSVCLSVACRASWSRSLVSPRHSAWGKGKPPNARCRKPGRLPVSLSLSFFNYLYVATGTGLVSTYLPGNLILMVTKYRKCLWLRRPGPVLASRQESKPAFLETHKATPERPGSVGPRVSKQKSPVPSWFRPVLVL